MSDFTYGTSEITKKEYDVYLVKSGAAAPMFKRTGSLASHAIRIGAIAENPTLTTEKGEEVTIGTGDVIPISENYSCEFSVYQVTSANVTALRALHGESVDVYLTDTSATALKTNDGGAGTVYVENSGTNDWSTEATSGEQLIKLEGAYIYAALNIQGNAQNSINVSITKEQGVGTSAITITEAS